MKNTLLGTILFIIPLVSLIVMVIDLISGNLFRSKEFIYTILTILSIVLLSSFINTTFTKK